MRNYQLEHQICRAIKETKTLRIRYDRDTFWREFEPQALFISTADHVNVTGIQTEDKNKPQKGRMREVRNFELMKINAIEVMELVFQKDQSFNRNDRRFENGLICSG
ncbi:MAG: hypothetical protein R2684_03475 [Pyrinomonadaceae bacterium]